MRVISGYFKGRKLYAAKGRWLRPTTDRIKTSIFDAVGSRVYDARVLDLFAGSGALGIEALSRGARSVVLVDSSDRCVNLVRKNLDVVGTPTNVTVVLSEALSYITQCRRQGQKFDLVLADPPYDFGKHIELVEAVLGGSLLSPGGFLVVEYASRDKVLESHGLPAMVRQKKFGDTAVAWYETTGGDR